MANGGRRLNLIKSKRRKPSRGKLGNSKSSLFGFLLPYLAIAISILSLKISYDERAVNREDIDFTIENIELLGDKYPLSLLVEGRVVNVSDVDISLKQINAEVEASPIYFPSSDGRGYRSYRHEFLVDGVEHYGNHLSRAGVALKAGMSRKYSLKFRISTVPEVIEFSEQEEFSDWYNFLSRLCRELKIDYHGDQLNEAQTQLCPAFHVFSSEYNLTFGEDENVAQNVFWFEVETYRGNSFRSNKYKPEIGGSKL